VFCETENPRILSKEKSGDRERRAHDDEKRSVRRRILLGFCSKLLFSRRQGCTFEPLVHVGTLNNDKIRCFSQETFGSDPGAPETASIFLLP